MTRGATLGATLALMLLLVPGRASAQSEGAGLTAAPRIARAYDAIFDARFAEMPAILADTCPPAPEEVCGLLDVVALWWQIQMNPHDRARDDAFRDGVDAVIGRIDAWTRRAPQRAEAWFYLGGAYGARAQWRVLRGQRVAAARDGQRIKSALEQALELDPSLQDAYFGVGLYHYYADVAPAAAKVLRWLLLLPGGDRTEGMQEMLRARRSGQLLRSEADYQLHLIYLWYEKRPDLALDLLETLHARHPRNPHFLQRIAEVEDVYRHDARASLRSWQALLDAATAGRVAEAALAETAAQLGLAAQLARLDQPDAALPHLRAVIDRQARAPYSAVAQAQLLRGEVLDRLGRRTEALMAYEAAIAETPSDDPLEIRDRARAAMRDR